MKVLSIVYDNASLEKYPIVDTLLEKGVMNDIIFNEVYLLVRVIIENPVDYLYLLLYEGCYMRRLVNRFATVREVEENNTLEVQIPLSMTEAILFIQKTTPPIFINKVRELYKNKDVLLDTLKMYLTDKESNCVYNVSVFKQGVGAFQMDTQKSSYYDSKRYNLLRNTVPVGMVADIIIYDGGTFNDIIEPPKDNKDFSMFIQSVLITNNKADIISLIKDIRYNLHRTKILNIWIENNEYFIELSIEDYNQTSHEWLTDIVKKTYSKLL